MEKIAEMHQEVQVSDVMRKRGSGGGEGDNAHQSWPETATEVAARRPPVLAAWWHGEEGGVGKMEMRGWAFYSRVEGRASWPLMAWIGGRR